MWIVKNKVTRKIFYWVHSENGKVWGGGGVRSANVCGPKILFLILFIELENSRFSFLFREIRKELLGVGIFLIIFFSLFFFLL